MAKQTTRIGYKHFFDDVNPGYKFLVERISSKKIIQITSIFNNQHLFNKQSSLIEQQNIMNKLLVSIEPNERERISYNFIRHCLNNPEPALIFNVITNLKIIEYELINYREIDDNISDSDLILLYFKAYLAINDEIDIEQVIVFDADENSPSENNVYDDALKFMLPAHLPYHELTYKYDFVYQLYLAIKFCTFIETRPDTLVALESVLRNHSQKSWRNYLIEVYKIASFYTKIESLDNVLRFDNIPEIISRNSHRIGHVPEVKMGRSGDFTFLRIKPIIQIADNEFVISYLQLLLDKVFQGFRFDFLRAMAGLPQYKNFGNAATEISQKFSHPLFESLMKTCLSSPSTKLLFDKQINHITDCYARENETIYLIEFKDEIIPINVKCSSKFDEIKDGIFQKFVFNTKENRKKAIHQLIGAIEGLSINLLKIDPDLNVNAKITYIPIIVYTDVTLDFPGINKLLNDEFKTQRKNLYKHLNGQNRGNVKEIKDLVIINFRLFVEFQSRFQNREITLKELIKFVYSINTEKQKLSLRGIKSTSSIYDYFSSTDNLLTTYIKNKLGKFTVPDQVNELINQLFQEENEVF
jgi:hypothetical protein